MVAKGLGGAFTRLSIRRKLVVVIVTVTAVAMIPASLAGIVHKWMDARQRVFERQETLSELLGDNLTKSLFFHDPDHATEILQSLRVEKTILSAAVYDTSGELFASYGRGKGAPDPPPSLVVPLQRSSREGRLTIARQIMLRNHFLGTITLTSASSAHMAFVTHDISVTSVVFLFSVFVAYFLSSRLQRLISKPIFELAGTARAVSERRDYSIRAVKQAEDEMGALTDSFNEMLEQIQLRDEACRESEQNFREIFNAATDAIFIHEVETGEILDVNQTMLDMYGYAREEIKELAIDRLSEGVSPFSRAEATHAIRRAIEEGPQIFEWHARKKDGRLFWVEVGLRCTKIGGKDRVLAVVRDISDRKESISLLREKEEMTQVLLNAPLESAILVDLEGRILAINDIAAARLGKPANDLIGTGMAEYLPPDLAASRRVIGAEAIKTRKAVLFRDQRDGRSYENGVYPVVGAGGAVSAIAIYSKDVTDLERAEQALQESKGLYRVLFESAGDAIFIIKDEVFVDCNESTLKLFGCDRGDIIGETPYRFSPDFQPDGKPSKEMAFEKISSALAGEAQFFEWRHRRKDGTLFDAEVRLNALVGPSGVLLQSIVRDITFRKRAEEALREREAQNALVMRSLPMAFYAAETEGRHGGTWVSGKIDQLCGFSSEDFAKDINLWVERLHPEDRERVLQRFESVETEGEVSVEYRWQKADGEYIWVLDNAVSIKDEFGKAKEIVGTWLDITEQKAAEEERVRLEAQMQQSQKMEAIGALAGGIAHDFNNILSAILGYSELARLTAAGHTGLQGHLDNVIQAGERAKDLVAQILAFSRQTKKQLIPVQPRIIANEVMKLLRASLPSTIEIRQDLSVASFVRADPTQLHQVLMNLCTNAFHAMRDAGGVLTVRLEEEDLAASFVAGHTGMIPGRHVVIRVEDTGHGIPREVQVRIFEPFYTTKGPGEGTGMGLSVARGIVEAFGGCITLKSDLGRGSCFSVYLPVAKEAPGGKEGRSSSAPPGGTERILFVDDEAIQGELARDLLGSLGYDVTVFRDSEVALDAVRKDPSGFDLVITDMTMPRMTGDILAKRIMLIRADMPIILATGFSEKISEEKALAMGIRAFVQKPILVDALARAIRKVLGDSTD